MVIIPNKFIYLATPRTGSRAIAAALMSIREARETPEHHIHPQDIDKNANYLLPGSEELPTITVIRDPYEQVLSVFHHVFTRHLTGRDATEADLLRFIKEAKVAWWFADRLYPYHAVADVTFQYQPHLQHTMNEIAYEMGLYPCPVVGMVGVTKNRQTHLLTSPVKEKIDERFPDDVQLYKEVTHVSKAIGAAV